MAATLAGLVDRVEQTLWDTNNSIFPTPALEEAVRQALGEYNFSLTSMEGAPVTLQGLDGAGVTSLPAEHESLVVLGAAGFAASGRALDRTEACDLNEETPAVLLKWGLEQLAQYRKMLSALRTDVRQDADAGRKNALRTSPMPPWGQEGWQPDGRTGEGL